MSGKTPNYNLVLPELDEYYDIGIHNDNYSVIDEAMGAHERNKNNPHSVTKAQVGLGMVDNTADIDKPISVAVQAAINDLKDRTSKGATIFTINADTFSDGNTFGGYPYKEVYSCNGRIVYLGLLQGYGTTKSHYVNAIKECGLSMYSASASQGVIAVQVTDVSKITEDIKIVIIDIGKYEGDNISAIVVNDLPSLNE